MDEATALLRTLESTPPDHPTACPGWTAHELVAHLAAGAAEMAVLTEASCAGTHERPTRGFDEREAPFVALADDELRDRLFVEALRLNAAIDAMRVAGPSCTVAFSGRQLTAADLDLHGRSEAALHRWDLVGSDQVSTDLLAQPELTRHAVTVLNEMLDGSGESPRARAADRGVTDLRAAIAAPGQPDVVLVVDEEGARLELHDPVATPALRTDAATRLLALWGRRSATGGLEWTDDGPVAAQLSSLLWPQPLTLPSLR